MTAVTTMKSCVSAAPAGLAVARLSHRRLRLFARPGMGGGSGRHTNEDTLANWLADVLAHGRRSDAILLRHAHRAAAEPRCAGEIADLAVPSAAAANGRSKRWTRATLCLPPPLRRPFRDCCPDARRLSHRGRRRWPPATALTTTPPRPYLQAFTANLISAAVRLVPLGQTAGLPSRGAGTHHPAHCRQKAEALPSTISAAAAFRSDLAAMRHETQYTRLFRT